MIKESRRAGSPRWRAAGLAVTLTMALMGGCATPGENGGASLRGQAGIAYEAGRYGDAALHYERYLRRSPDDPDAWYQLGNALAELDRLRGAEAAYYRALELDPELARARHNLGLVHMQLAWKNLLAARRELPEVDPAAGETMRYLACLMETFMGYPDPWLCRGDEPESKGGVDD